jgi:RHS repeat-associated protein
VCSLKLRETEIIYEGSGYTDIEYRYDALGRRIVRKQGTNKEVLLWWGNTEQSEHKHQAGQTTIQNDLQANPSEQALNTIFARALEGDKQDIQYFHKNYLEHVMAVSDDNGNLIEHYRYTAFGEPEIYDPTGTRLAATAIDNDILWNVRRYEAANGLYMYLYRDYDAPSGRWPSRDPIGEEGGLNLYRFGVNSPILGYDADGRLWSWGAVGLGAAVGAIYNGTSSLVGQTVAGNGIDWGVVGAQALQGAVAGAAVGAIAGALTGDPSAAIVGAAISGAIIGGIVDGLLDPVDDLTPNNPEPAAYCEPGYNCPGDPCYGYSPAYTVAHQVL